MKTYIIQDRRDISWISNNISFLIVTANENEKRAFLSKLKPINKYNKYGKYIARNEAYLFGIFGNYLVGHLHLKDQGSLKPNASSLSIQDALNEFPFHGVIMLGVAYGRDDTKQNIGDVLVCTKLQPIHSVKIKTNDFNEKEIVDRNRIYKPGEIILNIFKNIEWDSINFKNKLLFGTLLCGEELIDNEKYKNELIHRFDSEDQSIIGGEMEGNGLAAAMVRAEKTNWMIIKGICDFGDGNKKENKESRQIVAANNAVDYCYNVFKQKVLKNNLGVKYFGEDNKVRNIKQKSVIIDKNILYYYRNKKLMSLSILAKRTEIDEYKLRNIEKSEEVRLTNKEIKKLASILEIDKDILIYSRPDNYMKYFYQNKGQKSLMPVEDSKIVFFDFDGTLTRNKLTTWELIWKECGYPENLCKVYHRQFVSKDITHKEWCNITLDYFKKAKLDGEMMLKVSDKMEFIEDCVETLKILKENGIKLYIVSGSIRSIIELKFKTDLELFEDIKANEFVFSNVTGRLENIYGTEYDFHGKNKYIKEICSNQGINPNECIYIGNSLNDETVYETGIKTLIINPRNANHDSREIWNYYIPSTNSLQSILPYVLPHSYTLLDIHHK